jgi:hypothetical protein
MIEEAEYIVRITLTGRVGFSPIERDGPITKQDAIDNGLGSFPDDIWELIEGEGWSVEVTAEEDHG